jgi:C4-dicarboxylate-specific signal transduction histidine kinase
VAKSVRLSVNAAAPITEIISERLSRTALQTLISDHVKDAIISAGDRNDKHGSVLLNLARDGAAYSITVLDNGAPFEITVFDKLGRERVTTHSDSGGTGVGFMQTFATLKACGGSMVITEFNSGMPFTKSVGLRFDGKGEFTIKSPRHEQIKNALTREDVLVIDL